MEDRTLEHLYEDREALLLELATEKRPNQLARARRDLEIVEAEIAELEAA
jgi:hypothetical protein